jgi:hypothetical protein
VKVLNCAESMRISLHRTLEALVIQPPAVWSAFMIHGLAPKMIRHHPQKVKAVKLLVVPEFRHYQTASGVSLLFRPYTTVTLSGVER